MSLFEFGQFTMASGRESRFKIECDAVTPEQWASFASLARPLLPAYGRVIGVPRGGVYWASCFAQWVTPGSRRVLMVDDVWTTGGSMVRCVLDHRTHGLQGDPWHGLVLFARGPVPSHVTALFTLHPEIL